jgi:hypothetical protein
VTPLDRTRRPLSVFVAYPFDDASRGIVSHVIRPALANVGFTYADLHSFREIDLLSAINREIRRHDAFIAVTNGRNPNVFFEIGVASALLKPTILLANTYDELAMLDGNHPTVFLKGNMTAQCDLETFLKSWLTMADG